MSPVDELGYADMSEALRLSGRHEVDRQVPLQMGSGPSPLRKSPVVTSDRLGS